ncbi:MAG: hypothetical protein ACE5DN_07585 [Flavobacteriales bacterium]
MKRTIPIVLTLLLLVNFYALSQEVSTASVKPADQEVLNKRAAYVGGMDALNEFFSQNFNMDLINESTAGRAYFEFQVDIDGKVLRAHRMNLPNVIGFADQRIEDECIRILEMMPRWEPAIISGKKVETSVSVPVLIENNKIKLGS